MQISARCMLSIFQFFATKTDASVLRMLNGSPEERLLKPIAEYISSKGGRIHTRLGCKEVQFEEHSDGKTRVTGLKMARAGKEQIVKADAYIAALDVPGENICGRQVRQKNFNIPLSVENTYCNRHQHTLQTKHVGQVHHAKQPLQKLCCIAQAIGELLLCISLVA